MWNWHVVYMRIRAKNRFMKNAVFRDCQITDTGMGCFWNCKWGYNEAFRCFQRVSVKCKKRKTFKWYMDVGVIWKTVYSCYACSGAISESKLETGTKIWYRYSRLSKSVNWHHKKILFDFSKKENYNSFKRVADQRKSSFATRFFVHLLSHIIKIYHAVKSV